MISQLSYSKQFISVPPTSRAWYFFRAPLKEMGCRADDLMQWLALISSYGR